MQMLLTNILFLFIVIPSFFSGILKFDFNNKFLSGIFLLNLILAHMYENFNSIANGIKSKSKNKILHFMEKEKGYFKINNF